MPGWWVKLLGLWAILLVAPELLPAGDWPQILGPGRNGVAAADEKIADRWPRGGPPTLWQRPVGSGFAGPAVAGQRVILFHRQGDEEIIEALDAATGKTLYRDASPTSFEPQVGEGNGPLCVPTISQGRIVAYGPQGVLTCLDLASGQRLWQRKTHWDFKAPEGYFGAGSSPLIVGDLVIANVGGSRTGAGIVAFALNDGQTVWKATDEAASYSAPVSVTVSDMTLVLMVTRYNCLCLDPRSGTILFQFPFGQRGPTVNAATPLVAGDRLLVTASYGIGSVYGEFDLLGFHSLWSGERPLATQYCTPIFHNGHIYAIDGRDDVPPADLKCIELEPGRIPVASGARPPEGADRRTAGPAVKWVEQNFGYGTLLLVDGRLLAQKTDGELLLIEPSPSELKIVSRCQPFRGTVRALPAVSNGCIYLRDQDTLKCLNLAAGL